MAIRVSRLLYAGILCQVFGGIAHAADEWEVWPEVNVRPRRSFDGKLVCGRL